MGDGKKLKEILDSKNTNVRQIAKATGISATTLYSIIQKDSSIRFDFALRKVGKKTNSDENGAKFHRSSFLWHRFTYFHCCKVSKRASRFLGKTDKRTSKILRISLVAGIW